MGQEAQCTVRFGRKAGRGKALLEHNALIFRGDLRLVIPFKEIASVAAARGALRVTFSGGTATFRLGPLAERWVERIHAPKSLVDKLGVKPGACVAVLGVTDAAFRRQLRERTTDMAVGPPRAASDLIFLLAERKHALRRLRALRSRLKPNGAIWIVAPKGRGAVREADVLAAGKPAGLVDVKVVAFSKTHTAHKFMIPVAQRESRPGLAVTPL